MSDNAHDPRFDRDLEALSRAYRGAAQDEPPAELDAVIRAAARREVQARPQPLGRFQLRRWRTPLAAAAVLVLSVSTVMMSMHEWPDERLKGQSVVIPQLGGAPSVEQQMSADEPSKPAVEAVPAPPEVTAPAAPTRERKAKAVELSRKSPSAAPTDTAVQADNDARKILSGAMDSVGPADAAPHAFTKSLQVAPQASAREELARPTAAGAIASSAAPERRSAKAFAETNEPEDKADPEKWVKQISELRKEGKTKEAAESLVKFRAKYPAYPIPPEWLEKP
jgi:hypothetical protein